MRYAADFRKMTDAELTQALSDTKEEMFNLRFQWESGQLEDYSRIKQLKKELARLLTVQRGTGGPQSGRRAQMPNKRKRLQGRVVSNAMDKTVVVAVERTTRHPLYKKVIKITKKYKAHDETNAIPLGALVQIVESRPISKTKRWAVETVLETPDKEEA
jgi:small subunit ribosomal protein S17